MPFIELPHIQFFHRFTDNLPADPITEVYPRFVENAAFSWVNPTPTQSPSIVAVTTEFADELGLMHPEITEDNLAAVLTGNQLIQGMKPYAMCYGGHQFGSWANQLGDGRAINLGDIKVDEQTYYTLQLKGAGETPYSRRADGLAVLRSSIREFLCSEAMYHLGIPTTRALSLCLSGTDVVRDMFYDGNAKPELGAVVCRVSPSFMRFGHFQLPAKRGDLSLLTQLVHHCITHDYPHLLDQENPENITLETYLAWFQEICDRTCKMVVGWMRVGFVHGVMNTDNMSILGETIDYGPYGWIDAFDLTWTPNTTDHAHKRYRFGAQGNICQWNLLQLANAILPLVKEADPLEKMLNGFAHTYQKQWKEMMAEKLGLTFNESANDEALFDELEMLLSLAETDMTLFFRLLSTIPLEKIETLSFNTGLSAHFSDAYYDLENLDDDYSKAFDQWFSQYLARIDQEDIPPSERTQKMNAVNPKYILRNYIAQQAIDKAENGDYSEIHTLQKLLQTPYDEQPEFHQYALKRPEWARKKAGCSMLSCSS